MAICVLARMRVCVLTFSYAKHISYEKLRVATMFMASMRDIWFVFRKHTRDDDDDDTWSKQIGLCGTRENEIDRDEWMKDSNWCSVKKWADSKRFSFKNYKFDASLEFNCDVEHFMWKLCKNGCIVVIYACVVGVGGLLSLSAI